MKLLGCMLAVWLVVGCGPRDASGPVATETAVRTATEAVDRFIAAWAREIRPRASGPGGSMIDAIDQTMRAPDARRRYRATLVSCSDATRTMEELSTRGNHDYLLFGSYAAAHALERCWAIDYICCMKGDAGGVIDPSTSLLVVAWRIPEG